MEAGNTSWAFTECVQCYGQGLFALSRQHMLQSPSITHTRRILIMPLQSSSYIRLRNHELNGRKSQESQQTQMPILKMRDPLRPWAESWRSPGGLAFTQHVTTACQEPGLAAVFSSLCSSSPGPKRARLPWCQNFGWVILLSWVLCFCPEWSCVSISASSKCWEGQPRAEVVAGMT